MKLRKTFHWRCVGFNYCLFFIILTAYIRIPYVSPIAIEENKDRIKEDKLMKTKLELYTVNILEYTIATENNYKKILQPPQDKEKLLGFTSFATKNLQDTDNQNIKNPFRHRSHRQVLADDKHNDKCRLFVEGEGKNELYSPDYPNNYPKNINCTRIISAPKGQIIRLDFRNSFHIEAKEECKFDFLEIRDGQYGFSKLIGKFCGTDFPPEITSKERYLWIHFHSDESIEYSGFTAVYEFLDRNRDAPSTDLNCTIEKDGYEGFVNSSDVPHDIKELVIKNKVPLDCMWKIQVQEKWKIQVKFLDFKLSKPNDCETNFLDIFPEQTVMPLRVKNFCGSAGEGITSDSNILHVRFYAELTAINSTFAILYTAFRDRGTTVCNEDEYDCEDATCISKELQCNGRDNCKFRWDEEGCAIESGGQSEHVVIIIIVFGLILGGMLVTFLINCVRKIMRDQKIIREHIRQSKESKLDEIGRNLKLSSRDNISASRQREADASLQFFDDLSQHYMQEFKEIESKESILRQQKKQNVNSPSLISSGDNNQYKNYINVCDISCQTRESVFIPPSQDPSSQDHLTSQLTTFGHKDNALELSTKCMQLRNSVNLDKSDREIATNTARDLCHHHYQQVKHIEEKNDSAKNKRSKVHIPTKISMKQIPLPPNNNQQNKHQGTKSYNSRNSAPDVIIMTSH